jgi:hypothetical protein
MLLDRLHAIPDPAPAVLRPASVLGQGFTEDLLTAATSAEPTVRAMTWANG